MSFAFEGHRRRNSFPSNLSNLSQQFFDPSSAQTHLVSPPTTPTRKSSSSRVLPAYKEDHTIAANSRGIILTPTKLFTLVLIALSAIYLVSFIPQAIPQSLQKVVSSQYFSSRSASSVLAREFFDEEQSRLQDKIAPSIPNLDSAQSLPPRLADAVLELDQHQIDLKSLPRPIRRSDPVGRRNMDPEELMDQEASSSIAGGKYRGGGALDPKLGLARITMMNRLQRLQGKEEHSNIVEGIITVDKTESKKKMMKLGSNKKATRFNTVEAVPAGAFDEGEDLGEDEGDE